MNKKLIFLHIPKTAGQSVHQFLVDGFPEKMICPLRVDAQYSVSDLSLESYRVFSGHINWSRLEKLQGTKVSFTILRQPIDRILSYYFYLRNSAKKLSESDIQRPEFTGMKASLQLSPDEYFCDASGEIRNFIDDHYDNFYMYYFAGKNYNSRRQLLGYDRKDILKLAISNLMGIDGLYTVKNWENVANLIKREFPEFSIADKTYFMNRGDSSSTDERMERLIKLGATTKTINNIEKMCNFDNIIYQLVKNIES